MPGSVTGSFWLWIGGALVGLVSVAFGVSRLDELTTSLNTRVRTIVEQERFNVDEGTLDALVSTILFGTFGGLALLVLIQALLAGGMRAQRGWTRVPLVISAVLTAPVLLVAQDLLTGNPRLGVLLQAIFIVAAVVAMFRPESNEWFRRRFASE